MSDELDLEPEAFFFSLPVYVVVDPAPARRDDAAGAVRLFQIDGSTCLTLFTDLDLAERFITAEQLAGRRPASVGTQSLLENIILAARERGTSQVAIDVSGRRGRFFPLEAFLDAISDESDEDTPVE